jgi:hypothetical protein
VDQVVLDDWTDILLRDLPDLRPDPLDRALARVVEDAARTGRQPGALAVVALLRPAAQEADRPEEPDVDPDCQWSCRHGLVEMLDRDGYAYLIPCTCRVGQWRRSWGDAVSKQDDPETLARRGWSRAATPPPWPAETLLWVQSEAARRQLIRDLLREIRGGA